MLSENLLSERFAMLWAELEAGSDHARMQMLLLCLSSGDAAAACQAKGAIETISKILSNSPARVAELPSWALWLTLVRRLLASDALPSEALVDLLESALPVLVTMLARWSPAGPKTGQAQAQSFMEVCFIADLLASRRHAVLHLRHCPCAAAKHSAASVCRMIPSFR
jgi:hypothetical protein